MADTNICPNCGSPYSLDKAGNLVCRFCGYVKPKAPTSEEESLLYAAAQALRLASFEEAEEMYQDIVERFKKCAEAYWGLTLCQYGIKFEDDYDGKKIPTCYATQYESFLENPNYKKAISYASEEQKAFFENTALRIEKTRKEWIEKAEKEPPYDIFLSYKDTEDGKRTDDSYDAHELYNTLTGLGYRVFFSRVTLAGKTGENYEPYIFSALNSAPVMLVFASKPEYVTSTWVKNEWSRYLSRIRNGHKQEGSLAVIFRNFSPSALPRALSGLQNLKYGEITFLSNLKSYVDKYIEAAKASSFQIKRKEVAIAKKQGKKSLEAVKAESITSLSKKKRSSGTLNVERRQIGGSNVGRLSANEESKLAQAEIYLSRKDFKKAESLYEEVLEKSPKNAEANIGKTLCAAKKGDLRSYVASHYEKEEEINGLLEVANHASEETANKILQGFADGVITLVELDANYFGALSIFTKITEYDSKPTNELPKTLLELCQNEYCQKEGKAEDCIDLVIEILKYLPEERHGALKIFVDAAKKKQDYAGAVKLYENHLNYEDVDANDYLDYLQMKGEFATENDLLSHVGESGDFSCFTNDLPLHSEEIDDLFDILSSWAIKYFKLYPRSAPKYIPFLAAYRFPRRDEMIKKAVDYCCAEADSENADLLDGILNSFGNDAFDEFSAAILRFVEAAKKKCRFYLAERFLSRLIEYDPDNASLYEKRLLAHLGQDELSSLSYNITILDDYKDIETLISLRGKKKVSEVLAPYLDACLKVDTSFEKAIKVFESLCAYLPQEESDVLKAYLEKMAPLCQKKSFFGYAEKFYSALISLSPMAHAPYWGLLQSKLRCKEEKELIDCDTPLSEFDEFENAKLAASGDKEALAHYIDIEMRQSEAIKERQGKALAKKKKKRRHIFFGVLLGLFLAVAAAMTALTFTTFIPSGKVSSASASIRNGNYQEAINTLSDLSYGESKNLLNMAYAGSFFSKNDYEQGIDYVTKAGGETTVHYDAKDGSTDKTEEIIRPKKKNIDNEAFKLGYDASWKQTKFQLDIDNKYSASLWLEATYTIKTYTITYELAGGTNSKENPTTYTVEDTIALKAATREGYTFTGWVDGEGSKMESINAGTTAGNLILTATWNDGDQYLLTLDLDGGEADASTVSVQYDKEYALPTPAKKGYEFLGWHLEDSTDIFPAEGTWRWTKVSKLIASWSICTYTITYEGISDVPSSWPTTYTVNDEVTLPTPTVSGHTFEGWTDEKRQTVTSIPTGSVGHRVFYANWAEKYTITILVDVASFSKGLFDAEINGVRTENVENFDLPISWNASITLTAKPAEGYAFKGWYEDKTSALVSKNSSYTFAMPSSNYCLIAHFWTQAEEKERAEWNAAHGGTPKISEDGKTVTYGLYPQTHISDSALLAALDALDDSAKGANGWYLYDGEYYAKASAKTDDSSYKFNDETRIVRGRTYWFKCEPIKWDVLSQSDSEYYILSDVLLDAHRYHNSTSSRTIGDETIFPNNYEHSDIRAWLNGDFYGSAFAFGNGAIQATEVDNSASTTDSPHNDFACVNTKDKVFLPSYQDYLKSDYGFSTSAGLASTRFCKTTDWARARGAHYDTLSPYQYNGYYWTRSPHSDYPDYAWDVSGGGYLIYDNNVTYANRSVRPAITLKIA